MAGINPTGLPDPGDYFLGRGILYYAILDAAYYPTSGFRDLGNAAEFKISIEVEQLDHASSRTGTKKFDKSVILSQKITVSFILEELNYENVGLFLSGVVVDSTLPNAAIAGFTVFDLIPAGNAVLGRWYDIVNNVGTRATQLQQAADLTLKGGTSPVTLVKDTDYRLDLEWGRFQLMSTSAVVGLTNSAVTAALVADASGNPQISAVRALMATSVPVAIKFVAVNAASSSKSHEIDCHKLVLKAGGDLTVLGADEWVNLPFSAILEENTHVSKLTSPYMTWRTIRSPTAVAGPP